MSVEVKFKDITVSTFLKNKNKKSLCLPHMIARQQNILMMRV